MNQDKPKNYKKKGLILIIWPLATIFLVLSLFSIVNVLFTAAGITMVQGPPDAKILVMTLINFILTGIGLIATLGVFISIPIGIYFLSRKNPVTEQSFDPRSGKGSKSTIPEEIKGWSWGAAGLTWIWGAYHSVWISLISFIPIINWFFWIILAFKGNEWAWRKSKWESVEQFKVAQKKWRNWGIIFLILNLLLFASSFSSNALSAKNAALKSEFTMVVSAYEPQFTDLKQTYENKVGKITLDHLNSLQDLKNINKLKNLKLSYENLKSAYNEYYSQYETIRNKMKNAVDELGTKYSSAFMRGMIDGFGESYNNSLLIKDKKTQEVSLAFYDGEIAFLDFAIKHNKDFIIEKEKVLFEDDALLAEYNQLAQAAAASENQYTQHHEELNRINAEN